MGDGVVHLFTPKVTIMVIGLVVLVMVLVAGGLMLVLVAAAVKKTTKKLNFSLNYCSTP